jgi:acyl-coenzyme A thioesterase PaaI-like protein
MLAFDLVERLRSLSPAAANAVMGRALPFIIPLSRGMGIRVEELSEHRSAASLSLMRRTRNHVGSVYFGAQMTLAELTMGLLLFAHFPPARYGLLVKRVEADFLAKAKGRLRATCEPGPGPFSELGAAREGSKGKAEAYVPVSLECGGKMVAQARFLAALKRL